MASKAGSSANVCPVCLESKPLKIVGRCKHSFCVECILIALRNQKGDVFACPTCKVDCPRPWDGVKGMVDFTGEAVDITDVSSSFRQERKTGLHKTRESATASLGERAGIGREKKVRDPDKVTLIDVKCKLCHLKKKEVQAVNLCVKCGNLYICLECTEVHARNKITRDHVLVQFRRDKAMCKPHDSLLNSYCIECAKVVCMVCVILEHGDHTVKSLEVTVRKKVNALKVVLEEKQKQMAEVTTLKYKLTSLKGVGSSFDKQDTLVKEIEDHAEECISHIMKSKEDVKNKLKTFYKSKREISVTLEKLSETIRKLQAPLHRASTLLSTEECHQGYIDRLAAQQKELEALSDEGDDIDDLLRQNQPHELHFYSCRFFPIKSYPCLGKVESYEVDFREDAKYDLTEIFKYIYKCRSKDSFIQCVANLGQKFAVAKPTRGKPAVAIDIFEFPGTLKRTLEDHVPPLYDMSATPDGKLAVLSNGTQGTGCSVKLFDPDTGYMSSTRDIDIAEPLSLGVTLQYQYMYVILGGNEQRPKFIFVVDKNGKLKLKYVIEGVKEPTRITCGGSFIFVQGECDAVFEMTGGEIHEIANTRSDSHYATYTDISGTIWDCLFRTCIYLNALTLEKLMMPCLRDKRPQWSEVRQDRLCMNMAGVDREARISARDGHIVVSHGQTVKVLAIEYVGHR